MRGVNRLYTTGIVVTLLALPLHNAWALTLDQLQTTQTLLSQIQSKCQQLQQWANFVTQMNLSGWTYTQTPYPNGAVTTTYDAAGQAGVQSAYAQMKADLQSLVRQLP